MRLSPGGFGFFNRAILEGEFDDEVFQFLELLANHEDIHLQELVAVTVCERLGDDPATLHRAYKYMGTRTRQFSDEVEAFWGRQSQPTPDA